MSPIGGTEFSRAYLRNVALLPEPLRVQVTGEGLGDAGAGPVMLGVALHLAHPEFISLLWTDALGRRLLIAVLALLAAGVAWMRWLVRIQP